MPFFLVFRAMISFQMAKTLNHSQIVQYIAVTQAVREIDVHMRKSVSGSRLLLHISVNQHVVIKESSINSTYTCFILVIVEVETQLSF